MQVTEGRWQEWLVRPEHVRVRQLLFQVHLWVGAVIAAWAFVISLTGSVLVFRNQFETFTSIDWILRLHAALLVGARGTIVNAIGAVALIVVCLTGAVIWWPGIAHWRRSLTIEWTWHLPRIYWDVHSAFGFWFFGFVCLWGVSGLYLAAPHLSEALYLFDPSGRIIDPVLSALSALHFGRFSLATQIVWAIAGLALAMLSFTGVFICCRRVIFQRSSSPKHANQHVGRLPRRIQPILH
jgi:uncharacterized iron-regulated membrane protein